MKNVNSLLKKQNKQTKNLRIKLAAAIFFLMALSLTVTFLPLDFLKQEVWAALSGNYNKISGDSLTTTDWNTLDDDFLNVGSTGQSKDGGLILNHLGSAANGLIVESGNVGIGTTDPGTKLDVNGTGRFKQGQFSGVSGIPYVWLGYNDGARDYGVYQWQAAGTAPVNYFSNNVGIGTTNPGEKLDVAGNIKLSGASPTYKIINLAAPTADSDAATKGYVDAAGGGVYMSVCGPMFCSDQGNRHDESCPSGWTLDSSSVMWTTVNYAATNCPTQWMRNECWVCQKN